MYKNILIDNQNPNISSEHNKDRNPNAPLSKINPAAFVLLTLVIVFITYQIFGGILSLAILGADFKTLTKNINLTRVIVVFSQFAFILIPVYVLSNLQGNKSEKVFRLYLPKFSILVLSIIGVLVIQPTLQAYLLIQNKLLEHLPFGAEVLKNIQELMKSLESATMNLVVSHSALEFLFVAFVIAVTPAICEEFLFRGLILKNFERTMTVGKSIFLTGFVFALFHFHPFNLIPLILLGFYLSFIVYYSNSIFTGIIVHFVNNFLSAYLVYKYGREGFDNPGESIQENMSLIIAGVAGFIIFLVILSIIKKLSDVNNKNKIFVNV